MKPKTLFNLLAVSFLVVSLFLGAAPARAGQTAAAAPAAAVSPEGLLNPDGSLNLSTGFQGALDLSGWEVTLDSVRGPLLTPAAQATQAGRSASGWDPSWNSLSHQGLNGPVYALAVMGEVVYVGGTFDATGDGAVTGLNRIATYTPGGSWYALANQGLNGDVRALAVIGDDLYVGGGFSATADGTVTGLYGIARYHTPDVTWHPLPHQGLNGAVYALAVSGASLCVGGAFTATGDWSMTNLGNVAFYNTVADAWYSLSNWGLNGVVNALAVSGADLYVGGQFTTTGDGTPANLGYIARYNVFADTWHALSHGGLNGWVLALAVVGTDVYAGGTFTASGDGAVTSLNMIAWYDTITSSWDPLDYQGLNNSVYALAVVGDDLYVGGSFSQTADGAVTGLGYIVRWDTSDDQWCTLPNLGLNNPVSALAAGSSDLYVGGQFTATGDGTLTNLGRVAGYSFTPAAWTALPNQGLNSDVAALAMIGSDLYVGGAFNAAGDGTLTYLGHITRYDTIAGTWHALADGGLNARVNALAVIGTDLYVGGAFTATDDGTLTNLGRIARYDTIAGTWHQLPKNGLNDWVLALAAVGSDLYVGGIFTQTGDGTLTNLGRIARYDTTANTWHALPKNGLNGAVLALAGGDNLYVGGDFTASGDGTLTSLGHIARYDLLGSAWHALPNRGLNGEVYALAALGADLYVGGAFAVTGDAAVAVRNIARYDAAAETWHPLPRQGLNGAVYALAVTGGSLHPRELYVGGIFDQTADGTLTDLGNVARYHLRSGAWQALPNRGVNNGVIALAVGNGGVFAGGYLNGLNDGALGSLGNIAHYGDIAWRPLYSQGLNGEVEAMAAVGSDLYVGGRFTATGDGALANLGNIARYDTATGTWHALSNQGLDYHVYALAVVGSDLYVGGGFTQTGDGALTNLGYIARYNTVAGIWHALARQGLNDYVEALAVAYGDLGADLYVGGYFSATGDGTLTNLGYIARYATAAGAWHALPQSGLDGTVEAMAVVGDALYVGGGFWNTGNGALTNLNCIARYDMVGETWSALPHQGLDGYVYALAVMDGDLYVGGDFNETGDGALTDIYSIVRYDTIGGAWHPLPRRGLYGLDRAVKALAVLGPDLYVGGEFQYTEDETMNDLSHVARYDSAADAWHVLPNQGLSDYVSALLVLGGSLYAGGTFEASGDGTLSSPYIARIRVRLPYQVFLPLVLRNYSP